MDKQSIKEDVLYELYHIPGDRPETNNLADEYPEKARKLKELMIKEFERTRVFPRPY